MSRVQLSTSNPFALLMDPQSVFDAIEKSERLERLHSRICRPLDKPILPSAAAFLAKRSEQPWPMVQCATMYIM